MKARPWSSRSRMLVAIGVLTTMMLACASTGTTPTKAVRPPVVAPPVAMGTQSPRSIPTLVPTYTRLPSLTPTATPTRTPTPTSTATRTQTPTRQPTPTREPSNTPVARATGSTGGSASLPVGRPAPAVCPAPQDRTDLHGKVIFLTDRENSSNATYIAEVSAVYVMAADGSDQRPVSDSPECAHKTYDYFQARLALSNDSRWSLNVENSGNGTSIFLRGSAGQLVRRVTTLDGLNYNPAWAPDQARLAFVSQVDMNDEIYTVGIDGIKTRRLTFNTWEWDKHPSWSVDGKYIVFWSNRETARKQIWLMRDDGQGQHNLSNSAFNDWDPIWVNP